MPRPYRALDGETMFRQILSRLARLERGTSKGHVPELTEEPEHEIDGAVLYVFEGELRVRIGESTFSVNLTPL